MKRICCFWWEHHIILNRLQFLTWDTVWFQDSPQWFAPPRFIGWQLMLTLTFLLHADYYRLWLSQHTYSSFCISGCWWHCSSNSVCLCMSTEMQVPLWVMEAFFQESAIGLQPWIIHLFTESNHLPPQPQCLLTSLNNLFTLSASILRSFTTHLKFAHDHPCVTQGCWKYTTSRSMMDYYTVKSHVKM